MIRDVGRDVVDERKVVTNVGRYVGRHVVEEQGIRTSHISFTYIYTRGLCDCRVPS